jgi:hypothetical protein
VSRSCAEDQASGTIATGNPKILECFHWRGSYAPRESGSMLNRNTPRTAKLSACEAQHYLMIY